MSIPSEKASVYKPIIKVYDCFTWISKKEVRGLMREYHVTWKAETIFACFLKNF